MHAHTHAVFWDLGLQTRSIYRLLKRKDVRPGLVHQEVASCACARSQ